MNAFLLLLIFFGIAVIQVSIGGMRPILAIPGYLLIALGGVSSLFLLKKSRPSPSLLCILSSVLFFGYILWRAYTSPVEYLSRPDRYMVWASLVVYFSFAFYITEPKVRVTLFLGLFLLAIGHIAIGAIQFSQENNFLPFGYLRADYGKRASGFYVCPNHYAGLLEMLAVMAAAFSFWGRIGIKTRILVLYFTFMAIVGLALSGSRGGYLSVAVAFATFAILSLVVVRWVRPGKALLIGSAAVILILLVGLASVGIMKKDILLSSRLNSITDNRNIRLQLWDSALQQYRSQPATGTGAGTYYYLGRFYRDSRVTTDPVWVHNDYYHLLAEYGYLGAIGCALFLGCHLWHALSGIRQIVKNRLLGGGEITSNALALGLGSLAAIAAILAHSIVDFNVHIPGNTLVLAAMFGILANPPTFRPRHSEADKSSTWPLRLILPICAVVIFLDAAPHLRGEWYSEKARVALRDNNYLTALRESQRGLDLDKTNPDLYFYLGEARRLYGNSMKSEIARNNMNEAALKAFADSIQLFPQDEKVWVRMSQALDLLGRHEEAFAHLEKARALDPKLSALNIYYAAHFQIQGDDKKALEYYQKAEDNELSRKGRTQVLEQIKADGAR